MLIACRVKGCACDNHDLVVDRVGVGVTWYQLWFLSTTEATNIMFPPECVYHVAFIQVESDNGRVL